MEEELDRTIEILSDILVKLGSVDICSCITKRDLCYQQGVVNRQWDRLFKLNKHLKGVKKK